MNYELIAKSSLVLVAGLSHSYGLTPPQPPTPKDASFVYHGQHFETMVLIWAFLTRVFAMTLAIFHVAVSLAAQFPDARTAPYIMDALCPYPSSDIHVLQTISPSFIFGTTIMILACLLRAWCFSTLGRLFTYLVTVMPDHVLIKSGPYAFVRHPSYTGVLLMLSSAAFTYLFSTGSYVTECGIMATPWKWLILYWVACCVFSVVSLRNRGKVEDKLLKKTFGNEWVEYSKKVPYSFVPYIF